MRRSQNPYDVYWRIVDEVNGWHNKTKQMIMESKYKTKTRLLRGCLEKSYNMDHNFHVKISRLSQQNSQARGKNKWCKKRNSFPFMTKKFNDLENRKKTLNFNFVSIDCQFCILIVFFSCVCFFFSHRRNKKISYQWSIY